MATVNPSARLRWRKHPVVLETPKQKIEVLDVSSNSGSDCIKVVCWFACVLVQMLFKVQSSISQ